MRLSTDKADPGYADFCRLRSEGRKIFVTLNGDVVPRVIAADSVEGWVIRPALNANGRMYCDRDGDLITELLTGKVSVVIR
jgi:hypothetical protein